MAGGEEPHHDRDPAARSTWEVIIGSVAAWSASCFWVTGPSACSQLSEASSTNCTCVSPYGLRAARCAACQRLVTCQSSRPGLWSGSVKPLASRGGRSLMR